VTDAEDESAAAFEPAEGTTPYDLGPLTEEELVFLAAGLAPRRVRALAFAHLKFMDRLEANGLRPVAPKKRKPK
jgi:hypothetical protein